MIATRTGGRLPRDAPGGAEGDERRGMAEVAVVGLGQGGGGVDAARQEPVVARMVA